MIKKKSFIVKKIGSVIISIILIALILFVLVPPATAVYLHPGTPSTNSLTVGDTITFEDVNLTIRGSERIPIMFLNFSIFNNATGQLIGTVIFTVDGNEISMDPSNAFNVTLTSVINPNWYGYGYGYGYDEYGHASPDFGYGYGYGYGEEGYADITFLYDINFTTYVAGEFYGKLFVNSSIYTYESPPSTTFTVTSGITISNPYPADNATGIPRPPTNLSAYISGTNLTITFYFHNMTPKIDQWTLLNSWSNQSTGRFEITNLTDWGNDFLWGNTTYTWSINVTDGSSWVNVTYTYTTTAQASGADARYDVNNDNDVDVFDLNSCWSHRDGEAPYDGIYDVNNDNSIDVFDLNGIWSHRS